MPIIILLLYLILCVIFPPALIVLVVGLAVLCLAAVGAGIGALIGLPLGIIARLFRRKPRPADVAPAPVPAPPEAKKPETPKGDSLGLALEWFGKGAGALLVLALGVALVSAVVGGL